MKFRLFGHHQPDVSEAFPRFLPSALLSTVTYLTIFILGLQYAYYLIFTFDNFIDDEGTMILLVDFFIKSRGNFDIIGGHQYYGPFYYLVKYLIHYLSSTDISHNTNRLTTIAFWGLAPVFCAFFVHRLTRSLLLAAIVQLQLILLLVMLISSAGHPQELLLLLIAIALVFSSYVGSRHSSVFPVVGMAGVVGAILLVKINIGVYLGAALALSMLVFLPPRKLALAFFALAAFVAALLPVAVMGNFVFQNPLDRSYCMQVTFTVIACLVTARKTWKGAELRWADIGWAAFTLLCTVFLIGSVAIALGGSLGGMIDTVLLRALQLTANVKDHESIKYSDANVALASVLLAIGYRLVAPKIETSGRWLIVLCAVKMAYGVVTLYGMYYPVRLYSPFQTLSFNLPFQTLSFIWIILIPPHPAHSNLLRTSFPRVFLCFSAAFQAMQAFPVAGAQLYWSIFLLAPLAAICIGDAFSFLWMEFGRRRFRAEPWGSQRSLRFVLQLVVISCIVFWYWQKMGIEQLRATYVSRPSLGLEDADRIHLGEKLNSNILAVVGNLREHCDGFVAIPGMPSLYFYTGIKPPGVIMDNWVRDMDVVLQPQIIDAMENYENPCVVYNPWKLKFWTKDSKEEIPNMPIVDYINHQYTLVRKIGAYQILQKKITSPVE